MILADLYRLLEDEERILPGDQWKLSSMSDEFWHPVDSFIGKRVRDLRASCRQCQFRRLIGHETQ